MDIDIELKNYRCFPDEHPARFAIRPGFTAFVGANNSGKSSLLKFFFEFRNLFAMMVPNSGNFLTALRGTGSGTPNLQGLYDQREIFSNTNDRDIGIILRFHDPADQPNHGKPPDATGIAITVSRKASSWSAALSRRDGSLIAKDEAFNFQESRLLSRDNQVADLKLLFRGFGMLTRCLYIGPFRNAVNVGGRGEYFDIQVGQQFIQTWRQYRTGNDKAANEATYRLTKDIMRLFGYGDLTIDPTPENETLQVFVEGKSYKLPELGSGLAQFIIVLANAAIKQPTFVLIDEPELNLHPSLQLDFLTTLASYSTQGVLFGTHSIGLARASAERIFSLRRLAEGRSEVHTYETISDLPQFLGELAYAGYRELGIEKVLLVEGPTDLTTVRQFLRKYGKEHSALQLQLGGSSMINEYAAHMLTEIQRIAGPIFALIDSEKSSAGDPIPANRSAFKQVCEGLGIHCHILSRRSLENYLTDAAVKRIKGDEYRALGEYERLAQLSPRWSKAENWRIAVEMDKSDLDGTDLGAFFEGL